MVNKNNRTILPFPRRVQKAIMASEEYLKPLRQCTQNMLNLYQNAWYKGGESGSRRPLPINLLDEVVGILLPYLVSRNPKVLVTPRRGANVPGVKIFAKTLELALSHLFDEIKLARYTLRPVIFDFLFSMGITKTGIMHSHSVDISGTLHDIGQPFCDRIDFNDYIIDVAARNREEMKLEGHKYRLPYDYVCDSGLFKNYGRLKPDIPLYGDTSPEQITKGDKFKYEELRETVELIDIYLPEEGITITMPPEGYGTKIMRTVEWDGPEEGPFDVLSYKTFPNSIVPIPPVYTWLDLNKTINTIVAKMREQSGREKTIGVYQKDSSEDAEVLKDARHGDLIGLNNVDAVKELTFGGWNSESFGFLQFLLMWANRIGPNLGRIGGGGANAPTLGQEQMLQGQALRQVDDMMNQIYEFTESITRKLAWFLWTDPLIVLPTIKRIGGVDFEELYTEAAKEGDFLDYTFKIEAYSLQRMNPEMRFQRLIQLISAVVLPLLPVAMQQGSGLNVTELLKELDRYVHISNIDDWWFSQQPSDTALNPYQPLTGTPVESKKGVSSKKSEASDLNNLGQQQSRAFQESSVKL